jgi:hypothetical protein
VPLESFHFLSSITHPKSFYQTFPMDVNVLQMPFFIPWLPVVDGFIVTHDPIDNVIKNPFSLIINFVV